MLQENKQVPLLDLNPHLLRPAHAREFTRPHKMSRLSPVPPGREVGMNVQTRGVISQERLKIEVKLLLSANSAVSIGITTDDLE